MKIVEESYYKMFGNVSLFMKTKKSIWEQNTHIVSCVNQLNVTIGLLKSARANLLTTPKGFTMEKVVLRKKLNDSVFSIKEAQRLYYRFNNMSEEMLLLTFPFSTLQRKTEDTFYVEASHISETAITLATQLASFGITQAKIDNLKVDLKRFYELPPQKEKLATTNSNIIKFIPVEIKKCRLMLKNVLDGLITIYKTEQKDFVSGYKLNRRRVIKPGKHKVFTVTITGKVTDSITKQPLNGIILLAGNKLKPTTTDIKGIYKIKIYKKYADCITFNGSELYLKKAIAIPDKSIKNVVTLDFELEEIKKPIAIEDMNSSKIIINE